MDQVATSLTSSPGVSPGGDGEPRATNASKSRWIVPLCENLAALFRQRPDVFVASNLLWYPVEGNPEICLAPDVLVVFGRPKGHRDSYRQWEEGNTPLIVVFEIISPETTMWEWIDKQEFYEEYGVEEYYLLDPDRSRLHIYQRRDGALGRFRGEMNGFVSPCLGVRFDLNGDEVALRGPQGQGILSFGEARPSQEDLLQARDEARQQREEARQERDEALRAREQAEQRSLRIIALSRKARQGQATPEELLELEHLEREVERGQSG
jgi:Uma2 family endonuclease